MEFNPEKITDTLELSRQKHKELKKHNLTDMRNYYNITQANTHRALSDAYVTMELLRKLLK
jgi:DNA polymerase III epsilon subunit-like protein